ncbi:P-loop containing nucleoside triphosphate hydrolase protein [Leucosporidium creatinivorum]|uniref:ATP-dependent DNA helicase n=1 Tax=Leucosporidium creatinivorum TaxID=106004 RepID=A0A1Y2FU13_9BASI|nr:P-loop containing nucleoside triphosphate hydrolase protein [Leucosporidium creatinivorum]
MGFTYAKEPRENPQAPVASTSRPKPRLPDLPPIDLDDFEPSPPPRTNGKNKAGKKQADVIVLDDEDEDDDDEMEMEEVEPAWTSRPAAAEQRQSVEGENEEDEEQLAKLDVELASLDEQIKSLRQLRATLQSDRSDISNRIQARRKTAIASQPTKPKAPAKGAVDYTKSNFPWSSQLKTTMKQVWGHQTFRPSQEAAINASLAGAELCAILPTGGGKSLIYQLPAILAEKGTTIVISPLISLMDDQVYNLKAKGISAEQINASTTQEEVRALLKRMLGNEAKKGKGKAAKHFDEDEQDPPPKLVYVTPERLDKSKTFMSTLTKMYDSGLLVRFVIDEAHCISTMGHDYRTSYQALRRLKALFPSVPILCTTATAPASVIADMLKTLALPTKTSPGEAALPNTTVLFSSPLYRPNLIYQVLPKPSAAAAQVQAIIDYIEETHKGDTGIIYCLTRADCENVVRQLSTSSVRAAVYHAQLENDEKLRVQDQWRRKKIHVVVATNASFGLGIDKPDVRFVIHHSLAKSLSNFYQESGRAGRDGLQSDCVLFSRAADVSRISTLIYESYHSGGKEKLFEMVKMCEDLRTCRKILFARSFEATHSSSSAFAAEGGDEPCQHCDNCLRDPSTYESLDISHHAYRALRILSAAGKQSATLTLPQAADLVRGLGKGGFSTQTQGSKGKGKGSVDVNEVAGGKVTLDKDTCEAMLMRLLVDGYLVETFHGSEFSLTPLRRLLSSLTSLVRFAAAYSVIAYLQVSSRASRFTRISPEDVEAEGLLVELLMDVRVSGKGKGKGTKRKATAEPKKPKAAPAKKKTKVQEIELDDEEEEEEEEEGFFFEDDEGQEDDDVADAEEEEALLASGMTEEDGFEVYSRRD